MDKRKFHLNSKAGSILDFLLKNKITTCKTINENLFPNMANRSVRRYLSLLVNQGLITRSWIPSKELRSITVYHLTQKGLKEVFPHLSDVKNIKLKSDKTQHDFMLSKIRHRLKSLKNVEKIWSENEIIITSEFEYNSAMDQLKDLRSDSAILVDWNNEKLHIAIEYEASMKLKARVKDKFVRYYSSEEIDAVIYICKNKSIKNALIKIEKVINTSGQGRIYYSTVDLFLNNSGDPVFTNILGKRLVIFSTNNSAKTCPNTALQTSSEGDQKG